MVGIYLVPGDLDASHFVLCYLEKKPQETNKKCTVFYLGEPIISTISRSTNDTIAEKQGGKKGRMKKGDKKGGDKSIKKYCR